MSISERLSNEYKRLYTLFVIVNGKGFYIEDGKMYTRKEFEDKYPTPLRIRVGKKENADKGQERLY